MNFYSRWSRLKQQGGGTVTAPASVVSLPDPATLNFDDDFSGFLRQEVEESVKRVALKKLFHSATFNVMDGLDVYIDDYSLPDPIDEATLRTLTHTRELLFDTPEPAADASPVALATVTGVETAAEGTGNVG
jgi:hypothetical protein